MTPDERMMKAVALLLQRNARTAREGGSPTYASMLYQGSRNVVADLLSGKFAGGVAGAYMDAVRWDRD